MAYAFTLAVFFIIFTRLTLTHFRWAVVLMSALLPAYVVRFQLGPLPTTALEGMFLIVLAYWACLLWKSPQRAEHFRSLTQTPFFWPGLLLVSAAALSVVWSADPRAALGIWRAYFVEPFLFYLLLVDQMKSKEDWKQIFIALGAATLALAAMAVIQRVTGWWSPTWEWTQPGSRRVTGVYTSPNALGLFIIPVISAYAWFAAQQQTLKQRWPLLVIAAGVAAVLLAVSKGAMIAFLPVLLVLAWSQRSRRMQVFGTLLVLLAVLAFSPLRAPLIKLATFQTDSGQSRLQLYRGSIALLKEHPFKGLGLASFEQAFERVRPAEYTEKLIYPHNFFLNFWSETGLLGLAAILWITAIVVSMAWRLRGQPGHPVWAFILVLLPMLAHGLIDVPYFKNDLAMLTWMMLAGLSVCYTNDNSV